MGIGGEAVISDRESFGQPKLSGDPRGYLPLVAGRSLRKGDRERSDRWKGETRSGFPLQGDLAFIGNMRRHPGDELQVIHPLGLIVPFAIAVADLACPFIEGEAFQGKKGTNHVFSHPLGLDLRPGPEPAVNIEARVAPRKDPLGPFGTQQLLADEHRQDLSGEKLSQPRVVDAGDLMEDPGLVHSALGHQEMEMRVEVDPVAKGLDGGNDPGCECTPGYDLKITGQRAEGAATKLPQ